MAWRSNEWKFLAITAVLVSLLGLQGFRDLVREDDVARTPASLAEAPIAIKPSPVPKVKTSEMLVELSWNCHQNNPQKTVVRGDSFRLKGRFCGKASPELGRVKIINESNGFTASVFERSRQEFETDLIQLQEGQNTIRIQPGGGTDQFHDTVLTIRSTSI